MAVVGTATVKIVADTSSLEAQIKQAFSNVGLGDSERTIDRDLDRIGANANKKGKEAGDSFGKSFSKSLDTWGKSRKGAPFEDMMKGMLANAQQLAAMGSMMYGLVGGVMSLVNGFVALGASALAATPALLQMGNVFAALLQGFAVGKSLFSGVGGALSALTKQQKASSKAMESQAERALRVAQAQLQLERATLAAARAQEDATRKIEDAERALVDAIEEEKDAQENAAEARKNATETIIDYQFALEDAALTEERAILNLKKAEKELAKARAGGNANAIYEADLAYREQELSLRKLQESNQDLAEDADKAFEEGVDGNEQVQDALKDVEDATRAVTDAQRDLTRAMEDAPLQVRAATLALEQAMLGLKKAMEPADKNAFDALNDAMAELSPAAQDFVRYFHSSVKPVFSEMKKLGQEEFFPNFTKAVQTVMTSDFIPILEDMVVETSRLLGEISLDFAEAFTSAKNMANLDKIFESNVRILESLGDSLVNLIDPLLSIGAALAPGAERAAAGIEKMTESFANWIAVAEDTKVMVEVEVDGQQVMTEMSQLESWFYAAEVRLTALKDMFKSFGGGLKGVFEAALPAGDALIQQITDMGTAWSDSFDPAIVGAEAASEKQKQLTEDFQNSADTTALFLDVATDLGGVLFRMGGGKGIQTILQAFKDIIPEMETIMAMGWEDNINESGEATQGLASSIAEIIRAIPGIALAFSEMGAITVFFDILSDGIKIISDILRWIAESEIGQKLLPLAGIVMGVVMALSLVGGMFIMINKRVTSSITSIKALGGAFKSAGNMAMSFGNTLGRGFDKVTGRQVRPKRPKPVPPDVAAARKAGSDVGEGFSDGVKAKIPDVQAAASQLARTFINTINQIFRMSSPSLVMFDAGIDVVKGFVLGIRTAAPEVQVALRQMMAGQTSGIAATGAQMGDLQMEAYQASISANTAENINAVRLSLEGAAAPALAEGTQIGGMVGEGMEVGIRSNMAENMAAVTASLGPATQAAVPIGARVGNSVGEGIELGIKMNGPENTLAVKQSLAGGVAVARTEGAKMGAAAGNSMNKGMDDAGKKRKGGGFGKMAGGLMGIAGIAMLLIPIFQQLWQNNEGFRESMTAFIEKFMSFFSQLMEVLMPVFTAIMDAVMSILQALMPVFKAIMDAFMTLFNALAPIFVTLVDTIVPIFMTLVDAIVPIFVMLVETIVPIFMQLIDAILPVILLLIETILPIVTMFITMFAELFAGLIEMIVPFIVMLIEMIVPIIQQLATMLVPIITMVAEIFMQIMPLIMELVSVVLVMFVDVLAQLLPPLMDLVAQILPIFLEVIMMLLPPIMQLVQTLLPIFVDVIMMLLPPIIQLVQMLLPLFVDVIMMLLPPIMQLVQLLLPIFVKLIMMLLPPIMQLVQLLLPIFVELLMLLLPPIMDLITILLPPFIALLEFLLPIIISIIEVVINLITWLVDLGKRIAEWLQPIFEKIANWFKDVLIPIIQDIIQWFKDLWQSLKDMWEKYGKPAIDAIQSAFQGVKDFIQGIIDGIKDIWNSLVDIIKGPIEAIVNGINNWLIKPLNSILGVFGITIPEISVNFAAGGGLIGDGGIGDASNGQGYIRGPGGPTDDRIPTMLSNGEYVVRSRSVSKVGRKFLDHLNKTGEIPGFGGLGKEIGTGGLLDLAEEVAKRGIAGAIGLVIDGGKALLDAFPNNKMTDWLIAILDKMKEWISDWAVKKEGEMEAAVGEQEASGSGQSVGTYDGPADGWTYPLSKKFPWYTRPHHSPGPGAYDVGSPIGIEVRAVSSGRVVKSLNKGDTSYGQYIQIVHADGSKSLYAHMKSRTAFTNDIVKTGQMIGLSGNSGGSSGPHLHFELAFPKDAIAELKKRGVKMATGGIVSATPGGVLAVLAEAGRSERVTPLDANGRTSAEVEMLEMIRNLQDSNGMTVVNHIYPSEGMDERALAVKVSREIAYLKRRRS